MRKFKKRGEEKNATSSVTRMTRVGATLVLRGGCPEEGTSVKRPGDEWIWPEEETRCVKALR